MDTPTIAAAAALLLASLPALAEEPPPARYIGVTAHYTEPDDDRNTDHGYGFAVLAGRQIFGTDSQWFLEGALTSTSLETGVDGFTDFYQYQIGLDLAYAFDDRSGLTPFALIGVGAIYDDVVPDEVDSMEAYANAGLGLVTAPMTAWRIRLRAEARYIYDTFLDGLGDIRGSFGIEIPIVDVMPPPPPPPTPEPEIRLMEPKPLPDGDDDGVPDMYDLCPASPAGAQVNENGCAIGEALELTGVNFEFDSARLTVNAEDILDTIARKLKRFDATNAEIAGHTDDIGAEAYNQQLSEARAKAVRDYLVNSGVAARRLEARGYGESQPVADNTTDAGRERNRRVELRIR